MKLTKITAIAMTAAMLTAALVGCAAPARNDNYLYPQESYVDYAMPVEESYYEPVGEAEMNTEEYSAVTENRFMSVATSPLSTFAADVDTASYANIRRMINSGVMPEPDAVRIEEMLNYFHYDYPQPRGEAPFSVTAEVSDCPWNREAKLLLLGLQAMKLELDDQPPANFVFLLDVSGSMDSEDKLPLMKRAFILLTEQLRPQDRISIVTYASSDRVVLNGCTGDEKADIMTAIENLTAGGSTAGGKGITTAYELAEQYFVRGGNNRIILGTDGDLNVGLSSEAALKRLVEDKRESGIYLSVMGFGTGNLKDNKLETLADNGNGNYSYIDDVNEARRVLVAELGGTLFTVAKDVKLQVEFNPEVLKGYRLIGYENRLLRSEDFNDDSKDAGEIGAGHRVTALYEIIPVGSKFELPESTLKYQRTEGVVNDEWATLSIRYKEPEASESELLTYIIEKSSYMMAMSDNMRLAAAVAEFGMLLSDSEYAGTSSYADVLDLLDSRNYENTDTYTDELAWLVGKVRRMD